jgi:hypothetical protein
MLSHYWIGLLSPGCFVSDGVEGSLDVVNSHSVVVGVVDADPPKTHRFKLSFQLGINADTLSVAEVNQGCPNFRAVVMFPQILN